MVVWVGALLVDVDVWVGVLQSSCVVLFGVEMRNALASTGND